MMWMLKSLLVVLRRRGFWMVEYVVLGVVCFGVGVVTGVSLVLTVLLKASRLVRGGLR